MSGDEGRPDEGPEKRGSARVQPFIVLCGITDGDEHRSAYLTDLSVAGARVASTQALPAEGTALRLDVRFAGQLEPVQLPVRVIWVQPGGGPKGTNVFGVSFDGISTEGSRLLGTVLAEFRRRAAIFQAAPAGSEAPPTPVRRGWKEGPGGGAGDWLILDDDELLFRIEALAEKHDADDTLMKIVESERHFFIRQEAAKKIRDWDRLKAHSGDRHIGQILARVMARDEDVAYLQKLIDETQHLEVRKAALAQLGFVEAKQKKGES